MNTVQRIAKNTAALFVAQAVTAVLGLALSILIARKLGDVQFGKYSFATAFTALFGIFIELGYSTLLIREVARDKSLAGKYFANVAAIRLVLSAIVFTIMAVTVNLMRYPNDTKILVYLFGIHTILGSLASIPRVIFRAFEKMEYELITVIIKEVVRVSLGITILLMGYGLRELALVFVLSGVMDILVSFSLCNRKSVKPRIEVDWNFWKHTIKMALPLTATGLFILIYTRTDTVMLSIMKGDAAVGWYNAAYNLILGLKPFPQWFMNALFPLISSFSISSMSSLKFTYEKAFKYLFIVSLPMAIGIMLLSDRLILLFYGPAFENSMVALQVLSWDVPLTFLFFPLSFTLISINKQNQYAAALGSSALLNIILNLILIPHFSYVGAAIATIVTETVLLGICFLLVSNYLTRLPVHKISIPPLIGCGTMAVFLYLAQNLNLIVTIVIATLIYFITLYLAKGLSSEDINLVKQIINPSQRKEETQ